MNKWIWLTLSLLAVGCSNSSLENSNPKKVPYVEAKESEEVSTVGEITKESFRPALDILFVVDDSGSMMEHQVRLSSNVNLFVDAISKAKFLDYHIGVVTSSGSASWGMAANNCCGKLVGFPPFVDRNTPNGIPSLAKNLIVGTGGSSSEEFFGPVIRAFSPSMMAGPNFGFLRDDAYLAIIFLTDSDDQTKNTDPVMTFDFLKQLKGSAEKVFIGAAYVPDAELISCGKNNESDVVPVTDRLPDFFQLTNAMTFSLCDPDYGSKLAEIGKLLASKAQTMYLKQIPKKGTLTVSIGGELLPNDARLGWTYNPEKNALEFGKDIDWDKFPDNTYPVVDFESLPLNWEEKK